MAIDPMTAGLIGGAAGWVGQWFIIDRPVYRKLESTTVAAPIVVPSAAVKPASSDVEWKKQLDSCKAEREALQLKLTEANDEITRLKGDLEQSNSAFASSKKELGELRAIAPQSGDIRDDLEEIDGIGPVFERKLYDAGIFTFEQLAGTAPEKIRAIIAPQKWQKIEPEKWIVESAEFAKRGK